MLCGSTAKENCAPAQVAWPSAGQPPALVQAEDHIMKRIMATHTVTWFGIRLGFCASGQPELQDCRHSHKYDTGDSAPLLW